ncbi:hypothetical protein ACIO02_27325 [Streptomyces sp. NPDC087568]|uniref:hypothetical protein n=1 Tax=unclassified Streptomyces TaxID=2593676 RepID=UPI0037F27DFD
MHPINIGTSPAAERGNTGQIITDLAAPSTLLESLRSTVRDKPGTLGAAGLGSYIATGATHGNTTWAVVIISVGMLAAETIQNVKIQRSRA